MIATPTTADAYRLFHDGVIALSQMECNGVAIDEERLDSVIRHTENKIRRIEEELKADDVWRIWTKEFGNTANLDSDPQLGKILYDKMGIECKAWTRGGPKEDESKKRPSVSEKSLQDVSHPFVKKLFICRHLKKTVSTFLKGIQREIVDGFIHPFFNLHTATTYRSSCVAKGTLIQVANNGLVNIKKVPIEKIKVGDYVCCYDDNLQLTRRKALWAGKTGHKEVIKLHWEVNNKRGYIELTLDHKVRLKNGSYLEAQKLLGGQKTTWLSVGAEELLTCRLFGIEWHRYSVDVYDLQVEEFNNFIAGEVCVHNSDSPNIQFMPRRDAEMARLVRRCIVARENRYLWEIDFKGIEVACSACVNKDPVLIKYVTDPNTDMHRDTACQLFLIEKEQVEKMTSRDWAKNRFVFAEFYGSVYFQRAPHIWEEVSNTANKLPSGVSFLDHLASKGITKLGDCEPKAELKKGTFVHHVRSVEDDFWNKRFRVYNDWKKEFWAKYQEDGEFNTLTGFKFQFGKMGVMARNDALNYPIQSIAFHCLLWTLIRLQKWLNRKKMKTCLVAQIHDSMLGDSPAEELPLVLDEACRIVEEDLRRHWPWIIVPMRVDTEVCSQGSSWHDKQEWKKVGNTWGPAKK